MMLRLWCVGLLLLCALLFVPLRRAAGDAKPKPARLTVHYDTINGTLYGDVKDPTGLPLPAVTVIAKNQETGNERAAKTNEAGRYQIANLPLNIYDLTATKAGFVVLQSSRAVRIKLNSAVQSVPDIIMGIATALPPPPPTPVPGPTPTPTPTPAPIVAGLANQYDAARRSNVEEEQLLAFALPGARTFDALAGLAAGVAPPPEVKGVAGPGIGAGIGTPGQFAVNGQRARSNNFTVDGSDNNDEDIGVRRQGFASLVPQSIESVKEVQTVTHLWDAESGRSSGSQVNAVSKSGTNRLHGALYDFFNHDALNARNFFDYAAGVPQYTLNAQASDRYVNGIPVNPRTLPVVVRRNFNEQPTPLSQPNPSGGKDQFQRNQGGGVIGFPIRRDRTFFFGSFERQDVQARQETHFSVPTVAQRGFIGSGANGFVDPISTLRYTPTYVAGDSAFSLYPFPNNPIGPYGAHTYTQILPADAAGTIFSLKLDHNFKLFGAKVSHTLTGRYNFTNDERTVPAVGGALFSGLIPRVGTQNLSLFLNSQLSSVTSNQARASFGRTRLRFDERRDPYLLKSFESFLLNAPIIANASLPDSRRLFVDYLALGANTQSEASLGPAGQVLISPFSPVGLDVYLFPQSRANNTIQFADTLTHFVGNHTWKLGFDARRAQLNSLLNRNYRPLLIYGGTPDLSGLPLFNLIYQQKPGLTRNWSSRGPTPGYFTGSDLAALGLPTGIFQSLSPGTPDSTIGLRLWQFNFFANDNWRARRGLTLDYGLRYELNTVPREVSGKIERTFGLGGISEPDPQAQLSIRIGRQTMPFVQQTLLNSFNAALTALSGQIGGRKTIFAADRNNFGPRVGFAWDPFAHGKHAGKTAIRGGAGVFFDVTLGSVVSQSRNVFPTFVPFNVDANTFAYAVAQFFDPNGSGVTAPYNPSFLRFNVTRAGASQEFPLFVPGQLNAVNLPAGVQRQLLGLLLNAPGAQVGNSLFPSGGGLAFTLPDRKLRSPYTLQFNLQLERELFGDWLLNVAYVGTRGLKLTRFRTPNGGPNSPVVPIDPLGVTFNDQTRAPLALAIAPLGFSNGRSDFGRLTPALGAYTIFDSSASSSYHSLQASASKRWSHGFQMTAAYTWAHAIDDVSDVFDVAGAFTLPQDDRDLRAERGDANFDIRQRLVLSAIADFPLLRRFNDARGAARAVLGGWQFAALSTFQTGQPFTVNTSYDINLDGNLTDRLDSLAGFTILNERQQRLRFVETTADVVAQVGRNGRVGRNTFRAAGVLASDFAVIKNVRFTDTQTLVFRVEAFNVWNRTHFAVPVRILEAPSFGSSVDTLIDARRIQLALKYVF